MVESAFKARQFTNVFETMHCQELFLPEINFNAWHAFCMPSVNVEQFKFLNGALIPAPETFIIYFHIVKMCQLKGQTL